MYLYSFLNIELTEGKEKELEKILNVPKNLKEAMAKMKVPLLFSAIGYCDEFELLQLFLQHGADINQQDVEKGYNILHYIANGYKDGCSFNKKETHHTISHLIYWDCDASALNKKGETPLFVAVKNKNYEVAQYSFLRDNAKAFVNSIQKELPSYHEWTPATPIALACFRKDKGIVNACVGAILYDKTGWKPKFVDSAEDIKEREVEKNETREEKLERYRNTPHSHLISIYRENERTEMVRSVFTTEETVDMYNTTDKYNTSLLHFAIKNLSKDSIEIVNELISGGADPNITIKGSDYTPLHILAMEDIGFKKNGIALKIAHELVKAGAEVEMFAKYEGKELTPLGLAIQIQAENNGQVTPLINFLYSIDKITERNQTPRIGQGIL